jgi:hypothetical protein
MASPQSWNRYSYVLNNPINASDPTGHRCVGEPDECLNEKGKPINGAGGYRSGGRGGGKDDNNNERGSQCDGDPLCLLDFEVELDDIPGSADFWGTTSKVLDITVLVADFGLEALALAGLIIGAVSGAAFVDPITGLPGEVAKGGAGAFVGWSLVQLGVQPLLQANNFVALTATIAGIIGDDKMGNSDINLRTTLSAHGLAVQASGYASSSTLTATAITAAGFTPGGSLTETSTALQFGAVLNDFGKLPIPSFAVQFSNVPVFDWP